MQNELYVVCYLHRVKNMNVFEDYEMYATNIEECAYTILEQMMAKISTSQLKWSGVE
jgi:hypothetical protein